MKRIFFLLLFLSVICGILFSQSFDEAERLKKGDLSLLSENLTELALAKMNNTELRLLRNMIYAGHGHIFNSQDLTDFYLKFEWYKPAKKLSDNQLTENELILIKRILTFETRDEKLSPLEFGNEIIGIWHITPVMPATWAERFVIYPENKIDYLESNFKQDAEISEYIGHYEIKGNTLCFYAEKLLKQKELIALSEPLIFKFPVTAVSEISFFDGELIRKMIKIGSWEYYLFYDNPRLIYSQSRQ